MAHPIASSSTAEAGSRRSLWIAYASACAVAWLLYVLAGAEFQRGLWQVWQAVYQATLALWPPMLLGVAVFHRHTLPIALLGLVTIAAYKLSFGDFNKRWTK